MQGRQAPLWGAVSGNGLQDGTLKPRTLTMSGGSAAEFRRAQDEPDRAKYLATLLSTSFGPCGARKLCVAHGGASAITNEGLEVIQAAIGHLGERGGDKLASYPTALVRDTCNKHVQTFGDGGIAHRVNAAPKEGNRLTHRCHTCFLPQDQFTSACSL